MNHTWSRARIYDRGSGTKVVVPPPLELGLLLLDDYQRRKGTRACPACSSPINAASGCCSNCGHLPAGPTSAWPQQRQTGITAILVWTTILLFVIVIGTMMVSYILN